jgi:uridylate kinase
MRRVLIKLSGEALAGERGHGLDEQVLAFVGRQLVPLRERGVQLGIVVGGGNFMRGVSSAASGVDRVRADHAGMLATVINALMLADALSRAGLPATVFSAVAMSTVAETFTTRAADARLCAGDICIFGGGTGHPFFSTDTAAALRAAEIGADLLIKATQVDGVYSADPKKDPDAQRFSRISFDEVLARRLGVMDMTAFSLCRERKLPVVVLAFDEVDVLRRLLDGEDVGTWVHP